MAGIKKILVINPNSNQRVTDGVAASLAPFETPDKLHIDCMTLLEGPFGIETDAHVRQVVAPLKQTILREDGYDAYVIACYSDPGLEACRRATPRPVLGMQLSALSVARSINKQFGVLAIQQASIRRHLAYIKRLGLAHLLAAERSLDISVDEAANGKAVFGKLQEKGTQLVEEDGAEMIILGCAGMAAQRVPLEQALGITVVEPVQAAVGLAMGCVLT